jgi:hypothetical protein
MTQPSEPLEYQVPIPPERRSPVDIGTIVVCLLIASVLTFTPIFLVPRFEAIFRDFGMKLPLTTATFLQFSRAANGGLLPLIWLLAAVPVAVSIPLNRLGRRILRAFLYLVLVAILIWIALALFLPYVTLVNSVSGATPKP